MIKEIYPLAIKSGISPKDFYHMTARDIQLCVEAYLDNLERESKKTEYSAWLTGMYVSHAIGCNFSRNAKYPPNPLDEKRKKAGMTDGEQFTLFAMKHNSQKNKESK